MKDIVIYKAKNGNAQLEVKLTNDTLWLTQQQLADILDVKKAAISKHVKNIFADKELTKKSTVSKIETVQKEGNRAITRNIEYYNLDLVLSVGYRVNSKKATLFRQWATKTLKSHILDGYTINRHRIKENHEKLSQAIEEVQKLLPVSSKIANSDILELIRVFADTWVSLDAYDKDQLPSTGTTKKKVSITAEKLSKALSLLKTDLIIKGEATELFGAERTKNSIEGIVGNVMQGFDDKDVYSTVEEKAAHLLYFIIKNHPFVDGNKRSGAYAFIWFLQQTKVLDITRITPPALTALTLLIAASNAKDKDKMIGLVCRMLK